jgi:HSP20 family protein
MLNAFKKDKLKTYKLETHDKDDFMPDWLEDSLPEGQLMIDVYQTNDKLIVKSTMAGVDPNNLFISLSNNILTIKGKRDDDFQAEDADCLLQECYWGSFSRSVVLPEDVEPKKIDATLENGVLTVSLERKYKDHQIKVKIKS